MMKRLSNAGECLMAERSGMQRSAGLAAIFVTAVFMASCIAAIPIAIKYAEEANQTKAQAEMPVPAEKVYSTALEMAKEKDLKIVKQEDDKMYLEVTDGVQTASLKAKAAGNDKTEITVVATLPSQEGEEKAQRKEKEKELTLRIVNRLCKRLEVKCTIAKE